jgi:hypothetical protein
VKGVLMSWGGDDGVYFSGEGEPDRGLDGVAGDASGTDHAVTISVGVSAAETPHSNCKSAMNRYLGDLIFGADQRNVGVDRSAQRASSDLRTDTPGIAQSHGYPGFGGLLSRLPLPSRPLAYCSGHAFPFLSVLPVRS